MTSISRHALVAALGAILMTALAPAARAQVGSIKVTVLSDDGQPVSAAEVRLEGAGNINDVQYTDDNGMYSFVGIPAGQYSVTAVDGGNVSDVFKVELAPGGVETVKIPLKRVEAITQVIEIIAPNAEVVDVHEVSTSTAVTGEFISRIPLQNRRVEDIVAMMPGVIRTGGSDSSDISIAGGTGAQVAYRIDGQSGNNSVDGGLRAQIPSAAIASFKLITSGASARYGEQSTGVAEIVTKSGGEENDFSYELGFRSTDYGAQPIGGLDQSNALVDKLLRADGSILEQQVRNGFRLLGVDPISTTRDDNNPVPRQRVRNTVSAGGPIKPQKAFFHATLESLRDDYGSPFTAGMNQNDQILWTSKIDWNVWERDQASNRLQITANLDVAKESGFAGFRSTRSTNILADTGSWTLGLTDTHVFANHAVLESKLSISNDYRTDRPEDVRTGVGTSYQIPLPPGGPTSYFVGAASNNFDQDVQGIRLETNYSKAVGTRHQHTLDLGVTLDQSFFRSFTDSGPQVSDLRIVDDQRFFGAPLDKVGNALSFGPALRTDDSAWYAGLYASDNWQMTDNFVLQLGLRAEYQSFVGKTFVAPRVGFSLDPIGDGRTRFFGNWGIFYDRLFANFLQYTQQPDLFVDEIMWAEGYPVQSRGFDDITIRDIYKEALSTPVSARTAQGAVAYLDHDTRNRYVAADNLTAPTNQDWSIGLQRQLPGTISIEVTYRENRRTHQISNDTITRALAPSDASYTIRDFVYGTKGRGAFKQWAVSLNRPFSKLWSMNLSYVQSKSSGPIGTPLNPVDPNDVTLVQGNLGNDRTHVIKLQGNTKIGKGKFALDAATDFTWQSGTPLSAVIVLPDGRNTYPMGRNTLRLPPSRYLNFNLSKSFHLNTSGAEENKGKFLPTIQFRAQFYNLLNDLNVTGALARFRVPNGSSSPESFPPLRPQLLTTSVDVSRSLELGFTISF